MLFRSSLSAEEKEVEFTRAGVLKLGPQNPLEGLLKQKLLGPTPRVSDPVYVRWDPRMCISDKLLGGADALLYSGSTLKTESISSLYSRSLAQGLESRRLSVATVKRRKL